jgi:hypothetical protein
MVLEVRDAVVLEELPVGSLQRLTGVQYMSDDDSLSVTLIAWKGEGDEGDNDTEDAEAVVVSATGMRG